jgi:hypothetical protein
VKKTETGRPDVIHISARLPLSRERPMLRLVPSPSPDPVQGDLFGEALTVKKGSAKQKKTSREVTKGEHRTRRRRAAGE